MNGEKGGEKMRVEEGRVKCLKCVKKERHVRRGRVFMRLLVFTRV